MFSIGCEPCELCELLNRRLTRFIWLTGGVLEVSPLGQRTNLVAGIYPRKNFDCRNKRRFIAGISRRAWQPVSKQSYHCGSTSAVWNTRLSSQSKIVCITLNEAVTKVDPMRDLLCAESICVLTRKNSIRPKPSWAKSRTIQKQTISYFLSLIH